MSSPPAGAVARGVSRIDELPAYLELTADERAFLERAQHDRLPMRLSPEIVQLLSDAARAAGGAVPVDNPLRRQFIPQAAELRHSPHDIEDPLGEAAHSPLPRLVHRYQSRALLLVTDQCAVHCRHCFRSSFTAGGRGAISTEETEAVCEYLGSHPEIRELILSGGDALMLTDARIDEVLRAVRRVRPGIVFRLATRVPVVSPGKVSERLVRTLASYSPAWVVVQVNHTAELGAPARTAFSRLVGGGIPVVAQTVLLAGVNDDAAVLEELFTTLVRLRVKPYYLFQGDLAPGTAHFRVNLERALGLVATLRSRLSGLAMPVFAVDIPGGHGKVPLEPSAFVGEDDDGYLLLGPDGRTYTYPRENR